MLRPICILGFLLVSCSDNGSPAAKATVDPAAMGRAEALRRELKYDEALVVVNEVLKQAPASVDARRLKAEILLNLHQLDESEALLQALLKEHPTQPVFVGLLGLLRKEQGRMDEALALIDAMPANFRPKREYVELLIHGKRLEEAALLASRFLVEDPWHDTVFFLMAKIDTRREREEQAALWRERHATFEPIRVNENYLRNRELTEPAPDARNKLAKVLFDAGLWYESMALLDTSVRMDASKPEAFRIIGTVMRESGQFTEAVRAYEQLLKLLPEDEEGKTQLEACREAGENKPPLEMAKAHVAAERKDMARAVALLAAKQQLKDLDAVRMVGELFDADGDAFVRLWAWRRIMVNKPDDAIAEKIVKLCEKLGIEGAVLRRTDPGVEKKK